MMKRNAGKIFALLMSGFLIFAGGCGASDAEPEAATEETAEENASETNEDNNEAEESGTETDAEASSDEAPAEEASESDTDPSLETAQTQEDIPSPVISTPSRLPRKNFWQETGGLWSVSFWMPHGIPFPFSLRMELPIILRFPTAEFPATCILSPLARSPHLPTPVRWTTPPFWLIFLTAASLQASMWRNMLLPSKLLTR